MITRLTVFIALVALFYYYCKDDPIAGQIQNTDTNLLEQPTELSPEVRFDLAPEMMSNSDTSNQFISEHAQIRINSENQIIPIAQNY